MTAPTHLASGPVVVPVESLTAEDLTHLLAAAREREAKLARMLLAPTIGAFTGDRSVPPPPVGVMADAARRVLNGRPAIVTVQQALASLGDFLLDLGADEEHVREAFAAVIERRVA